MLETTSGDIDRFEHAHAEPLVFEDDRGAGRAKWIALLIALGIVGWMASGYLVPAQETGDAPVSGETAEAPTEKQAVAVAVLESVAQDVTRAQISEGQAEPDRDTPIRAETGGEVAEVTVRKGADLTAGQILARIAPAQRAANLTRAQEQLAQAERELVNARTLRARGATTQDRVVAAQSAFASAQAALADAQQSLDDTAIRAPFDGRLEDFSINAGEYITPGAEVGRIVDNRPLTIAIQIPQASVSSIRVGQQAEVKFITGEEAPGEVTFVGTAADASTRTFAAEIEVANADGAIPAGVSAEVRIPTGTVRAHFISPAILSLGTDGTLGIKTVDADNVVGFTPVEIEQAQTDGLWVSGLPESARIITVGQGFVSAGETVAPRDATALEGALAERARDAMSSAAQEVSAALGAQEGRESGPGLLNSAPEVTQPPTPQARPDAQGEAGQ